MLKELLISSTSLETKLAILEEDQVTEIFIERSDNRRILGNIYKGKVTRVLPGMQAAFVDIGLDRDTFLYVSDFFEDYEGYEALFQDEEEFADLLRQEPNKPSEVLPQQQLPAEVGEILPDRLDPTVDLSSHPRVEALPVSSEAPSQQYGPQILPSHMSVVQFEAPPPLLSPPQVKPSNSPEDHVQEKVALNRQTSAEEARKNKRKNSNHRNGKALIGDLLNEGQEILVQVAKESIGKKGARITSHCVLPGRYLVFMPTVEHVGVSRRIVSEKERERLKGIILRLRGDSGKGFIVRTVGENHDEADFRKDMLYLTGLWENIRSKAEKLSAPTLVYAEPSLIHRVVRDYFSEEYRAIRVDDEQEYERVVDFVHQFNPELVHRVRLYHKKVPIFDEYGVTTEIEKALRQKVWLKKGGYIVINQTEALVAIDVNTGKFVGTTNSLEDTITRTNLHAAKEVIRQIRLRDLGGIIVIDFIDMDERKNRQKVLNALQEELAKDKAPSRMLQFNDFGLVAITRKRVKQSLGRLLCQPCNYCQGTGVTKSVRTVCHIIHQEIQKMIASLGYGQELLIHCHPDVGKALRNGERQVMAEIEEMTGKVVSV
ncbi:Rne/Rng family ribonuclease, partial [Acidobacteria bacterium AH-259-D05]|nr:Rne/Rng family ribonuclease [Acidobacteria bacterium AH-259-D05]